MNMINQALADVHETILELEKEKRKKPRSRKSPWRPIRTASKEPMTFSEVDLWLAFGASPLSMGMADSFRVPDCTRRDGKWGHYENLAWRALDQNIITHWMSVPKGPK